MKLRETAMVVAVVWMTIGIVAFYYLGDGPHGGEVIGGDWIGVKYQLHGSVLLALMGAFAASIVALIAAFVRSARR